MILHPLIMPWAQPTPVEPTPTAPPLRFVVRANSVSHVVQPGPHFAPQANTVAFKVRRPIQ